MGFEEINRFSFDEDGENNGEGSPDRCEGRGDEAVPEGAGKDGPRVTFPPVDPAGASLAGALFAELLRKEGFASEGPTSELLATERILHAVVTLIKSLGWKDPKKRIPPNMVALGLARLVEGLDLIQGVRLEVRRIALKSKQLKEQVQAKDAEIAALKSAIDDLLAKMPRATVAGSADPPAADAAG